MDVNGDGRVDAEDVRLALDKAESAWAVIKEKAPQYTPQLRMCMGVGTLFYARSFPYTIVFCQAFRVNGWPQVKEGWGKLSEQYSAARAEFSRRAPSLKQAQATVASYPQDLAALQASNASPDDLRRLHEKHREAQAVMSSVSALLVTVDPYKVATILGGMWAGIASCIAATVAPSARCVAMGLHSGEKLSTLVHLAVARFSRKTGTEESPEGKTVPSTDASITERRWTEFYVDTGCRAVGMIAAFYLQRVMNSFQGCVIGSTIVVEAGAQYMRRRRQVNLSQETVATAQVALCVAGFMWQYKSTCSGQVPTLLKPLAFAPLCLESALSAFASRDMWSKLF
ncbi:hypothetical protein T484DRAFT_2904546 [Baffinella frigidus]|nr:hypothetical protein T484DRAFT_2904546 [Cryptophyta sp. CCMP2293]